MMLSLSQQIFSSKKLFRLPLLVLTGWMATWPALAAGPEKIATLERQLWPRAINTQAAFDQASGAEILSFVRVMATTELNTQADIQSFTGIDKVNTQSVQRWLNTTRRRLQQNYASACGQCAASADWQQLVAESSSSLIPPTTTTPKPQTPALDDWASASAQFYRRYLYEQVRLAALFPRITSEIDVLSEAQEITGFEFADGHFLLSYDDGPAASHNGSNRTQALTAALRGEHIHAQFFVLGERLQQLQPEAAVYKDQCLGSHGYVHKSHQKMSGWADSVKDTRQLLTAYPQQSPWLRPPYGQRHQALLDELQQHQQKVMLWNIDSQDWNRALTDQQVQDRVITLMLLWRRGIILYHDIHGRALHNLPALNAMVSSTGQSWLDCRTL
tara:strand:- start:27645 stop:28805 length:1161 start_codon:yes stop_codon:yes gene_type:complete